MRGVWQIAAAAGVAVVLVVSGCSSAPTQPAPASSSAPEAVRLDTGSYPTAPRLPLGAAGSLDTGRLIEGRRMAAFVVGPWQVESRLIRPASTQAEVITDRRGIGTSVIYPEMTARSSLLPIIVGFSCERSSADPADPTSLRNAVIRADDPDSATTIARGLADGALNIPPAVLKTASMVPSEPIRQLPIPAHPEATGILLVHQIGEQRVEEVIAISAHGPYVLVQVARSSQGAQQAADLASRTLNQQIPLIDSFTPTAFAMFTGLSQDPTGLLARTLPLKPGQGTTMSDATYDRTAALQLEDDPVTARPMLDAAGVDVMSTSQATVYRTADSSASLRLSFALADAAAARPGSQKAAAVPGLEQSRCVILDATGLVPKASCTVAVKQFVFKTTARQLVNAQQQLAAQYLMLSG